MDMGNKQHLQGKLVTHKVEDRYEKKNAGMIFEECDSIGDECDSYIELIAYGATLHLAG